MLNKDNFFKNYLIDAKKYKKNLKKTKVFFNYFVEDLQNNKFPILEPYNKNYEHDFSPTLVKKFSKFKNFVIIGMGGSILGTKCIYSFFKDKIKKKVFFFDNLDPNLNLKYKKLKNLKSTCYIVVSKSGNTLETITNMKLIFSKQLVKNKLIIITEIADNDLMTLAKKYQAEIIEHKSFIGGRYSVLSEIGMLPAKLIGLDIMQFKNLAKLIKNKNFTNCLIQNVATIYTLNAKGFKNSVIFNYDSNLDNLGYWYQQLIAESLGKEEKGINPILSFGPKDHHSLLQLYLDGPKDKFFTFINSVDKENKFKIYKNLKFIANAQCQAAKNIFKIKKIPFRQITFSKKNENELGEIFTFFILETILLSRLMNVNPFDQPAVEQVKQETKKFLR